MFDTVAPPTISSSDSTVSASLDDLVSVSGTVPLCFSLSLRFCRSLTFFGFLALTGPSACLFFHWHRISTLNAILKAGILPFHHNDSTDALFRNLSHLQRHQKPTSNIFRDTQNAICHSHLSGTGPAPDEAYHKEYMAYHGYCHLSLLTYCWRYDIREKHDTKIHEVIRRLRHEVRAYGIMVMSRFRCREIPMLESR